MVQVTALIDPDLLVEIEADAVVAAPARTTARGRRVLGRHSTLTLTTWMPVAPSGAGAPRAGLHLALGVVGAHADVVASGLRVPL